MESILFISTTEILPHQLQEVVSEMGGKWDDKPTLRHGVLKKGAATLFLNSPTDPSFEYDEQEISEMSVRLGARPKTVICIDIGHGEG